LGSFFDIVLTLLDSPKLEAMYKRVVAVPSRDWSVYRELATSVETVIHSSKQEAFVTQDLETALKKFRPDFISLLQNPVTDGRCIAVWQI